MVWSRAYPQEVVGWHCNMHGPWHDNHVGSQAAGKQQHQTNYTAHLRGFFAVPDMLKSCCRTGAAKTRQKGIVQWTVRQPGLEAALVGAKLVAGRVNLYLRLRWLPPLGQYAAVCGIMPLVWGWNNCRDSGSTGMAASTVNLQADILAVLSTKRQRTSYL